VGWGWPYVWTSVGHLFIAPFFFLHNQWLSLSNIFYLKRKKNREIIDSVINVATSIINFLDFFEIIIITAGYVWVRVDFQIPS
jgi:hypothetical protein